MWHSRPPRDPPPFMANAILNFHFDFPHTSLMCFFGSNDSCLINYNKLQKAKGCLHERRAHTFFLVKTKNYPAPKSGETDLYIS